MRGRTYMVQGRTVELPARVREARSGAATYLVRADAARRLLPGPELDVVQLLPGRALATLAVIDYVDNDLGDYNEVSIALFVRERHSRRKQRAAVPYLSTAVGMMRGSIGTYIHWLPVNQSFTCEAGRQIWGFQKTVEDIEFDYGADRVSWRRVSDGQLVLSLSLPRGGERTLPERSLTTYTYRMQSLHAVPFVSGAEGFGVRMGGAELTLGDDHPAAAELRSLGLPKRALMTTWMERMTGRFEAAEKL